MKTLSYSLMVVGMLLALGGVVAVFNFEQPADVFASAWWMIVGGWCLALTGMGMDVMHLFKITKREPAYVFHPKMKGMKGVEEKIPRV